MTISLVFNKLIVMELKIYISHLERGGATKLADSLGISISHLSQMAAGTTAISPARCVAIEQATSGAVARKDLRPDDYWLIWPEVATNQLKPI